MSASVMELAHKKRYIKCLLSLPYIFIRPKGVLPDAIEVLAHKSRLNIAGLD